MTITEDFGQRVWVWDGGNAPGLVDFTLQPETGADLLEIRLARRSIGNVAEYARLSGNLVREATVTPGTGFSDDSDPDTVDGDIGRVDHTQGLSMSFRVEVPQDDPTALMGRHLLKVAMKIDPDSQPTYLLRWGLGSAGPLPYEGDRLSADTTGKTAQEVTVPLGYVTIPEGAKGLYWELWSSEPGENASYFDEWWLEPAELVTVVRTGAQGGSDQGHSRQWAPDQLVTPPGSVGTFNDGFLSQDGDYVIADDSPHQAAGIPEVDGFDFEDTAHTFTVDCIVFDDAGSGDVVGQLVVMDLGDSSTVQTSIRGVDGVRWSQGQMNPLRFTPATGHLYYVFVEETSSDSTNIHIRGGIFDDFSAEVPTGTTAGGSALADGAVIESTTRRCYVLEDGKLTRYLSLQPPFPELVWSESTLRTLVHYRVDLIEVADDYDDVFPFPVGLHVPTRTCQVQPNVTPRMG
jgi:hypothetical protein